MLHFYFWNALNTNTNMRKLLTISMAALICATLLVTSCGKDDDDNNNTTTTTGTTGGNTDPQFFLRFNDGAAQALTVAECKNDSLVIFSEVIHYTSIKGKLSSSNSTEIECQFFFNKMPPSNQTEAAPGSQWRTVGVQDSLMAGRVFIRGFDVATNKSFAVTGTQNVRLEKVDGKFLVTFTNLNAAFTRIGEFESDENRRISLRNGCR
jgi:hypothetical protein